MNCLRGNKSPVGFSGGQLLGERGAFGSGTGRNRVDDE